MSPQGVRSAPALFALAFKALAMLFQQLGATFFALASFALLLFTALLLALFVLIALAGLALAFALFGLALALFFALANFARTFAFTLFQPAAAVFIVPKVLLLHRISRVNLWIRIYPYIDIFLSLDLKSHRSERWPKPMPTHGK